VLKIADPVMALPNRAIGALAEFLATLENFGILERLTGNIS
jgi:hypothetical protein